MSGNLILAGLAMYGTAGLVGYLWKGWAGATFGLGGLLAINMAWAWYRTRELAPSSGQSAGVIV